MLNIFKIIALPEGWWFKGRRVVYAQQCYCHIYILLCRLLSGPGLYLKTKKNGIEAYSVFVELGVRLYDLYMWYNFRWSQYVCLSLHIRTSSYARFLRQIYLHVINSFYSHIQTPVPA